MPTYSKSEFGRLRRRVAPPSKRSQKGPRPSHATQSELAVMLGLSVWSVRAYEAGVRRPSAGTLEKLRKLAGVRLRNSDAVL